MTEVTQNWQTFATWYSVHHHMPEASIAIVCFRNKKTPFQLFQWTKRLNVPLIYRKRVFEDWASNILSGAIDSIHIQDNDLLILTPLTMMLEPLHNLEDSPIHDQAMFFKKANWQTLKNCINTRQLNNSAESDYQNILCKEAKECDDPVSIVSYKKGVGRWIDTLKGCPFSNAAGLASEEMTLNERRIIEMWKQLVPLYNATA